MVNTFQNPVYFMSVAVLVFSLLITALYIRLNFKIGFFEKRVSLIFVSIAYLYWVEFLMVFGLISSFPHLFRTGVLASLIFLPLMYVTMLLRIQKRSLKYIEYLHALPFVLVLINFIPFFIQSAAQKVAYIHSFKSIEDQHFMKEGWLFSGEGIIILRIIQIAFYFGGLIYLWKKYQLGQHSDVVTRKMSFAFMVFQGLYFLITGFYLIRFIGDPTALISLTSFMLITILFFLYILLNPELLFNYAKLLQPSKPANTEERALKNPTNPYTPFIQKRPTLEVQIADVAISDKMHIRLATVEKYVTQNKPFLQKDFTLQMLSQDIGISPKLISGALKVKYNLNFNQYINRLRVQYALQHLDEQKTWRQFSIEALAHNVGFSCANSFYTYFKEFTGITPRVYIQRAELREAAQNKLPS